MDCKIENLINPHIYNDIYAILADESFSAFKNKTVFIAGAGQLSAYYLACALLIGNDYNHNNTKVVVCDRNEGLFEKYGNLNSRTDIDFVVSKLYSDIQCSAVDYIFNLDVAVNDNAFEAFENLLKFAQQSGCTTLLLCSDMDVYGEVYNGKCHIGETDEGYVNLTDEKGYKIQMQRIAENYAKAFAKEKNISIKIARLANILGCEKAEDESYNNFISVLFDRRKNKKSVNVHFVTENHNVIQSYIYVSDVVTALIKILVNGADMETYNVASGCDTSLKNITEIYQQVFPKSNVNVVYKGKNAEDGCGVSPMSSTRFVLDNSKLLNLGFKPKVSLDDGIRRTVQLLNEKL